MIKGCKHIAEIDVAITAGNVVRIRPLFERLAPLLYHQYGLRSLLFSSYFDPFGGRGAKVIVAHRIHQADHWLIRTYRFLSKDMIQFVNFDREQLATEEILKKRLPRDDFAKYHVYHLAWYEYNKRLYMEAGVPEEHIFVVGNFNEEILQELLEHKAQLRKKFAQKLGIISDAQWYFFPMNVAFAFDSFVQAFRQGDRAINSQTVEELHEFSVFYLKRFLGFVLDLAVEEKGVVIILRPHPEVLEQDYHDFCRQHLGTNFPENVIVTKVGIMHELIAAADVIGSSWSTGAYNAWRVGKPVFLFLSKEWLPPFFYTYWMDELPWVKDYEEFKKWKSQMPRRDNTLIPPTVALVAEVLAKAAHQRRLTVFPMGFRERIRACQKVMEMGLRRMIRNLAVRVPLINKSRRFLHIRRWYIDKYTPRVKYPPDM